MRVKIWVDDYRPVPDGYVWAHSVDEAISGIITCEQLGIIIDLIDTDHDAGDYAKYGGDYIKLLEWLEKTGRNYPIRIHTMNPVGAENMRRIIRKNNWIEL